MKHTDIFSQVDLTRVVELYQLSKVLQSAAVAGIPEEYKREVNKYYREAKDKLESYRIMVKTIQDNLQQVGDLLK